MPDAAHDTDRGGRRARRVFFVAGVVIAALAVAFIGLRIVVASPVGRGMVARALDGRPVGSLGVLDVQGLSGDPLHDMRVRRLAIADEEGEWLVMEDARLVWRPGALLHRIVYVERLEAETVRLVRRPPAARSADGRRRSWGVAVDALELPRLSLGEEVLGVAADLAVTASLDVDRRGVLDAGLDVRRTDATGDVLTAQARSDPKGGATLTAQLTAPAGGPLARLLRMPTQTIRATAELTGDARAGEGRLDATLDDAPFAEATGAWREGTGSASAVVRLEAASELGELRGRLGPEARLDLAVEPRSGGRQPVSLTLASEGLKLSARGQADLAARRIPGGLDVVVSAPRLDALLGADDVAALAAAEIAGKLNVDAGVVFEGEAGVFDVAYKSWAATRVAGPTRASWRDGAAQIEIDLTAQEASTPARLAAAVGGAPRLSGVLRYDAAGRRIRASNLALTGAGGAATGELDATLGGGPADARLKLTIADASTLPPITAGSAQVEAVLSRAGAGGPIEVAMSGTGEGLAGEGSALAQLLGARADLDVAFTLADGGLVITRASLVGEHVMAEASGRVDRESGYDLTLDAGLEGPLPVGPAELAGQAMAAGRIEGAYEAPTLRVDVRAGGVEAGPITLIEPRLKAELARAFEAPAGAITLEAMTRGGPAVLNLDVAYIDGVLRARTISGGWPGVVISGAAERAPESPPEGTLSVRGLQGRLAADVALSLNGGPARLDLDVMLRNQPLGETGALTALDIDVNGPIDGLDIAASAHGTAGAPFGLDAVGRLERADGETRLTLTPRGMLGEDAISAPEPWTATLADGEAHGRAALTAAGGELVARLDRQGGRTEVFAELTSAPLALVNFARPDPRLEGQASARIELAGERTLTGRSRIEIVDARAPDYAADEQLDLELDVEHAADGAQVALTARSDSGFTADVEGRAPLELAAWPPLPRLDRAAPVELTGRADGEIAPFWAVFGLPIIALNGAVDAEGSLQGTLDEPELAGTATVSGGSLEEARTGLKLAQIEAAARLTGPRLVIERARASDGGTGQVTAAGQIDLSRAPGAKSEVTVDLVGARVVDSTDGSATASGQVVLTRDESGASLGGRLDITRADIAPPQAQQGAKHVPTLDVVEINRPADLAPPPGAARAAMKLALDLRAREQVFVRSNSIDTEWSFDVTVGGTSQAPTIDGEATLVRGALELVGERFELERGRITFAGDVSDARLDFQARQDGADIVVIVRVTGTVGDPQIALESIPSYPQDEILSRMLFGSGREQLSPLEAAQLASALSSLSGGGGFDLLGSLRQTLGIDRLDVGASAEGTVVSGGRYVAQGVYLELSSTTSGLAQAALEWEIRPRLELVSRFGFGRDSSVTLRWRKDY